MNEIHNILALLSKESYSARETASALSMTVVNYISTTATKTGLRVDAHLVRDDYPTGVKVSDKEMKDLSVRRHDTQPVRNYTISPR